MKRHGKRRTGRLLLFLGLAMFCAGLCIVPFLLVDPVVYEVHHEVQNWRRYYGLPAQQLDPRLCRLAQQHADWMAANEWFVHGQHDQVIALGFPTAEDAVAGWIYSPGHRAWLLGSSRKVGWAWAVSASGNHYWVGVLR